MKRSKMPLTLLPLEKRDSTVGFVFQPKFNGTVIAFSLPFLYNEFAALWKHSRKKGSREEEHESVFGGKTERIAESKARFARKTGTISECVVSGGIQMGKRGFT